MKRLLLDLLAILVLGVIDLIVIDIRGIVVRRSFLLVPCSRNSIVELEYLLAKLIVLLVRVFNLADSISDRPSNLLNFPLGIFVLAISLGKFLPEVVSLFLEERNV